MGTMAVEQTTVEQLKEKELKEAQDKADATNKTRTGIGTRVHVGRTRGKGSQVVSWEAFDDSDPETLPKSISGFLEVTKLKGQENEPTILGFLIEGYNLANYTAASDPIAEFVEPTWPDDVKTNFRLVVRNYSRQLNKSVEDAVTLLKPGYVAQFGPKA